MGGGGGAKMTGLHCGGVWGRGVDRASLGWDVGKGIKQLGYTGVGVGG